MIDLESLFNLSYGMCIVSSKRNGKINGCIMNTVFQLTPEPPVIAISVSRENLTHEYIAESTVFVVSILAEKTPLEFMGRFGYRSGRDFDKFQKVNYKIGMTGPPIVLDNTVGFIEAEVTEAIDVETHTLFIGRVIACETIDEGETPMTYNYYRDVKGGRTPRTAATYIAKKPETKSKQGVKEMKKYNQKTAFMIRYRELKDKYTIYLGLQKQKHRKTINIGNCFVVGLPSTFSHDKRMIHKAAFRMFGFGRDLGSRQATGGKTDQTVRPHNRFRHRSRGRSGLNRQRGSSDVGGGATIERSLTIGAELDSTGQNQLVVARRGASLPRKKDAH